MVGAEAILLEMATFERPPLPVFLFRLFAIKRAHKLQWPQVGTLGHFYWEWRQKRGLRCAFVFLFGVFGIEHANKRNSTKFRTYGTPKLRWPEVGMLDHFVGNGNSSGASLRVSVFFLARFGVKHTHK